MLQECVFEFVAIFWSIPSELHKIILNYLHSYFRIIKSLVRDTYDFLDILQKKNILKFQESKEPLEALFSRERNPSNESSNSSSGSSSQQASSGGSSWEKVDTNDA